MRYKIKLTPVFSDNEGFTPLAIKLSSVLSSPLSFRATILKQLISTFSINVYSFMSCMTSVYCLSNFLL